MQLQSFSGSSKLSQDLRSFRVQDIIKPRGDGQSLAVYVKLLLIRLPSLQSIPKSTTSCFCVHLGTRNIGQGQHSTLTIYPSGSLWPLPPILCSHLRKQPGSEICAPLSQYPKICSPLCSPRGNFFGVSDLHRFLKSKSLPFSGVYWVLAKNKHNSKSCACVTYAYLSAFITTLSLTNRGSERSSNLSKITLPARQHCNSHSPLLFISHFCTL